MNRVVRTSLPFDAWPERDRALWQAALRRGAIFEPDGAAAHWAEDTRRQVAKGYGRWLGALQSFGTLAPEVAPATRVTEDHLRRYVAWLEAQGLASVSIASRITDLMENGKLFADLGLPALDPSQDRVMICGSPQMLKDLKSLLEHRGFQEGNTTRPGDFVIERAFAEQ